MGSGLDLDEIFLNLDESVRDIIGFDKSETEREKGSKRMVVTGEICWSI